MKLKQFLIQLLSSFLFVSGKESHHFRDDGRDRRWVFSGPPKFHPNSPSNVTAQMGGTGKLPCRIKNLGNKSVSWIRSRDSHILTVDRYTFIADERFASWHDRATHSWTLIIRYVQERDAGIYECQVSTEPKMSKFVQLSVIKPRVEISSDRDMYVKTGSQVAINCTIQNSLEEPDYIFWFHDGRRLVAGTRNHSMHVRFFPPKTTVGSFHITSASLSDSGIYTCEPAGLRRANVTLHVIAGEEQAAMQHGVSDGVPYRPLLSSIIVLSFPFSTLLTSLYLT